MDPVTKIVMHRDAQDGRDKMTLCASGMVGKQDIRMSLTRAEFTMKCFPSLGIFSPTYTVDGWEIFACDRTNYVWGEQLPFEQKTSRQRFVEYDDALKAFNEIAEKYQLNVGGAD